MEPKRRLYHLVGCDHFAAFPMYWLGVVKTPGSLRVLLSLFSHASAKGQCFPSVARIAKEAFMTERSVQRSLRELEELGIIQTQQNSGRVSHYQLAQVSPQPPTPTSGVDPRQACHPGATPTSPPPPTPVSPITNQGNKPFIKPGGEGAKAPTADEDEPTPEQAAANIARLKAMFGLLASAMMARKGA